MDCSPPGSSVHGLLQARTLEWFAMPSSRGSSNPEMEPWSPALQAGSFPSEPPGKPTLPVSRSLILASAICLKCKCCHVSPAPWVEPLQWIPLTSGPPSRPGLCSPFSGPAGPSSAEVLFPLCFAPGVSLRPLFTD